MPFLRKYGTGTGADVIIPIIKAGVVDHAVSADWTPAAGDVKISKDGGAAANITTLPTYITSIGWKFVFSDAELQAARINVQVTDSATKAVEDQHFVIETYGNASAQHAVDLDDSVRAGLTALPNAAADAAGGLPISDAGGLDLDAMNTNVSAILTDTGTTLDNHLTDIKGTGFAKDTHSLTNIEGYADLIDDGTSGLAKIATDVAAILVDTADMQPKLGTVSDLGSGATLGANNADMAGATFSSATDSQEAIRDRGDAAWITGSGTGLTALASGTAQSGTASTIVLAAGETFGDDILNGTIVKITSGTGAGQARLVTDYVGATDTASVTPNWTTNPDATSVYEVVEGPFVLSDFTQFQGADIAAILTDTGTTIPGVLGTPAGADLATDIAANQTDLDAILVDLADGTVVAGTVNDKTGYSISGTLTTLDALDTQQDAQHTTTQAAIAALNDPTAAAIADAVFDEATAGHVTAGTFGKLLADVLADTNELQTDDVPGLIAALNNLSAAQVNAEVLDVLNTDTLIDGKTLVAAVRIIAAVVAGKISGAGTGTEVFRTINDGADAATVTVDGSGNRSGVTYGV